MADINQVITLGIGTPSDIEHFILVGLNGVAVVVPPAEEGDTGGGGGGDGPTVRRPRFIRVAPGGRLHRLRAGVGARGHAEGRLSVEHPLPVVLQARAVVGGRLQAERRLTGGPSAKLQNAPPAIQRQTWADREEGLRAQLAAATSEKRMMESAMRALRQRLADQEEAAARAEEDLIISLIVSR